MARKTNKLKSLSHATLDDKAREAFFREVLKGSDRSAAIMAAAAVEHALVSLIRTKLIDLKQENEELAFGDRGLFATFGSRIQISLLLQLIDETEQRDLNVIKAVRNAFAHSVQSITFGDHPITEACKNLVSCKPGLIDPLFTDTPRSRYIESCHILTFVLYNRASAGHKSALAGRELRQEAMKQAFTNAIVSDELRAEQIQAIDERIRAANANQPK